jgi:serine/threonine-protein kinase
VGSGGTTLEEHRDNLAAKPDDQPTRQSMASAPGAHEHMAEAAAIVREGDVLQDRYRVQQRIGKGGMGEVYLAEHVAIGRKVAIKILLGNPTDRPEMARRFLKEAKTASKLRHANVVDIIDFGHIDAEGHTPFFVMEYLEGRDLKAVLKEEKVLPWPRVRDIALQICAGLAVAHQQGFIHRDLKPDNVYLIRENGREHVKLLDFGISKAINDEAHDTTQTGVLLGTPEYMSPEQAQDQQLDARSDIYALGVILYRMVVGRVPFQSKAFMTVLAKHIQEPPVPPHEANPEVSIPPGVEAVILRCLAKKPEDRFQSAEALAEALQGAERAPGIGSKPPIAVLATIGVVLVAAVVIALALFNKPPPEPTPEPTPEVVPVKQPEPEPIKQPEPEPIKPGPVPVKPEPPPDPPLDPPDTKETKKPDPKKTPKGEPKKAAPKDTLTAADLKAGFKSAAAAASGCAGALPGTTAKVDIVINTAGQVESATAQKPIGGSALGRCIEKAARTGKFPALTRPYRTTYPFSL